MLLTWTILLAYLQQIVQATDHSQNSLSDSDNSLKSEFEWQNLINWPSSSDTSKTDEQREMNIKSSDHPTRNRKRNRVVEKVYYKKIKNDTKRWNNILAFKRKRYQEIKEEEQLRFQSMTKEEKEISLAEKKRKNQERYQRSKAKKSQETRPISTAFSRRRKEERNARRQRIKDHLKNKVQNGNKKL